MVAAAVRRGGHGGMRGEEIGTCGWLGWLKSGVGVCCERVSEEMANGGEWLLYLSSVGWEWVWWDLEWNRLGRRTWSLGIGVDSESE